jgi:cytochrome c2
MPSIAPSSVKFIEGLDPRWDGDLLVGSLKYGEIVRVRLNGNSVQLAEHIKFQRRVRYAEVAHGRIYVLFDYGELAILTPRKMAENVVEFSIEAPADGVIVAPQNPVAAFGCLQCHGDAALPRLAGIVDKDIASQPRIDYSNALAAVPGTWTPENLRAFLTNTQAFAPGSTMPEQRLAPADIDLLIEALRAP